MQHVQRTSAHAVAGTCQTGSEAAWPAAALSGLSALQRGLRAAAACTICTITKRVEDVTQASVGSPCRLAGCRGACTAGDWMTGGIRRTGDGLAQGQQGGKGCPHTWKPLEQTFRTS